MPCSVYFTQQQLEGIQERMKAHAGKYVAKDDKKPEKTKPVLLFDGLFGKIYEFRDGKTIRLEDLH